jgi:hypothetical protein
MEKKPLESKFVRMVMPDASDAEIEEATRYWFAYLLLLDRIANEPGAPCSRVADRYVRVDGTGKPDA